ncbi:MAG: RNA polymerase sigma factor [Gemmataceae bacterium]|nr:RNA polymerase sigma factor [Gemmataceae bacterium]
MTDAELVRATLAGSRDAYAEIARRWAPRVTAICHSRVRRSDVADDLAQETLLRGYRALHTLSDPNKLGTWLMGIGHRASLDWLKARERSTLLFSGLGPDQSIETLITRDEGDPAGEADERRQLMTEVEALPENLRQVVMMYYYEDVSYRELAEILGISPATVNARLTKARAILRGRLTNTE